MALIILFALGAAGAQVIRLYLFPFKSCGKCGGTGRKHSTLSRRSFGLCPHCDGTGRVMRLGARTVHRAVLSARSPQYRERLRRREATAIERTQTPSHHDRRQLPTSERSNP